MDLTKIGKMRVVTVLQETSVEEAARLMREHHVGDVVVVTEAGDGRKTPVGILTDRDIVMATIALGVSTEQLAAGDLMTTEIATVSAEGGLEPVIDVMKEHGVKRVPILGKEKELVGIIALEDVMAWLSRELGALAEVAQRQRLVERQRRRKLA